MQSLNSRLLYLLVNDQLAKLALASNLPDRIATLATFLCQWLANRCPPGPVQPQWLKGLFSSWFLR
jgi:hypothetical protein